MSLCHETRQKLMGVVIATIATAPFKHGHRNQMIRVVAPVGGRHGTAWLALCGRHHVVSPDLAGLKKPM